MCLILCVGISSVAHVFTHDFIFLLMFSLQIAGFNHMGVVEETNASLRPVLLTWNVEYRVSILATIN